MSDILIFAGENYDPCGGIDDLVHHLNGTVDDAVAWLRENTLRAHENDRQERVYWPRFDWFQIVDARTVETVLKGSIFSINGQIVVCPPDEDPIRRVATAVSSCGEPWCPPIEALVEE